MVHELRKHGSQTSSFYKSKMRIFCCNSVIIISSCFLQFIKLSALHALPHGVKHRVTAVKQAEKPVIGPPISPDNVNITADSFENNCCQRSNLVNNPKE